VIPTPNLLDRIRTPSVVGLGADSTRHLGIGESMLTDFVARDRNEFSRGSACRKYLPGS
jgi:hypothetical protein